MERPKLLDLYDSEEDESIEDLEAMEVAASTSDLEDKFLHPTNVVELQSAISVSSQDGFVEKITNLKEWLKSPWVSDELSAN